MRRETPIDTDGKETLMDTDSSSESAQEKMCTVVENTDHSQSGENESEQSSKHEIKCAKDAVSSCESEKDTLQEEVSAAPGKNTSQKVVVDDVDAITVSTETAEQVNSDSENPTHQESVEESPPVNQELDSKGNDGAKEETSTSERTSKPDALKDSSTHVKESQDDMPKVEPEKVKELKQERASSSERTSKSPAGESETHKSDSAAANNAKKISESKNASKSETRDKLKDIEKKKESSKSGEKSHSKGSSKIYFQ